MSGWLVFAIIILLGLELALRSMPELIPLGFLKRFHHQPRLAIAQQRGLWNESQMRLLQRDDGGPALKLFKPNSVHHYDFHNEGEKGTLVMDDQGFCNSERNNYSKPQIDIISIGDSFTWCVAIQPQASWSSQLGILTNQSIYNLGRPGIGPYAYLQIFKKYGLPKHPQIVIMNLYEGNDLRDANRYQEHIAAAKHGQVLYANASDRNNGRSFNIDTLLGRSPLRRSYSVNFLLAATDKGYEGIRKTVRRLASGTQSRNVDFRYQLAFPDGDIAFNIQNADQSEVRSARKLQGGGINFGAFDDALEQFSALAQQQGFVPVIAYSPSAYTAYADVVQFDDPALAALMPWFSQQQRSYLEARTTRLGIQFVDLTPGLQQAARQFGSKKLLYHPANVHFTAAGNRIVAEALAAAIF